MVFIGVPIGSVVLVGLISPNRPIRTHSTREEFQKRPRGACLDQGILLIRLPAVLPLLRLDDVHLPPRRRQGPHVLSADAKEDHLGDVPKIEADTATVRTPVLANLVPDDVALVLEPPSTQHFDALGQQRVRNPQVKMGVCRRHVGDGKALDIVEAHRRVTAQATVLGRNLSRAVLELPRRIGQDRGVTSPPASSTKIPRDLHALRVG